MVHYEGIELHALLLDLDDTILDNRSGLREAWSLVARLVGERHGDLEPDAVRTQIGRSTRWFWSDPERLRWGRLDLPRSRLTIVEHVLEGLGRPDAALAQEAAQRYTELRDRTLAPLPGALATLERLRERLPGLGLVTNGAAAPQRAKIERFDLAGYFDVIVIEGEFGAGKPESSVFAHATATLDAKPEASLMVGDDYEADVLGALRAGLHAAWVVRDDDREPPAPAPRPHGRVHSIVELAERLGI